jgi:hypothetical protein
LPQLEVSCHLAITQDTVGARTRIRLLDGLLLVGAALFFGLFLAQWIQFLAGGGTANIGVDYTLYMDATRSWLAGTGFYLPEQLAGPYEIVHGVVLYPPTALLLLVPFTVLPAFLWWAIPVAVVAGMVLWHWPAAWAWLAIAVCLWLPITGVRLLHGNPGIWITMVVALGTRFAWPSVFVLLKFTLAPFALVGIRRRSWWIALGLLGAASLLFLPMWADYVTVIRNGSGAGVLYSLTEVPMVAIPVIAWLGGRHGPAVPRRLHHQPT